MRLAARARAEPGGRAGLHTLYISPLKALAVDVARNLETPIAEMGLPIRTETRTGDTSAHKRRGSGAAARHPDDDAGAARAAARPRDAAVLFADLETVVLDELHALRRSKRGDLLALGLARLRRLAPRAMLRGLVGDGARPSELRAYLVPQSEPDRSRIEWPIWWWLRRGASRTSTSWSSTTDGAVGGHIGALRDRRDLRRPSPRTR